MRVLELLVATVVNCQRQAPPFTYGRDTSDDLIEFLVKQNVTHLSSFFLRNELKHSDELVGDQTDENVETCDRGENLPNIGEADFTDGVFKCLMLQKCSIKRRKFRQLDAYYAANNIVNSSCLAQLEQFNRDLSDGQFHAQQMCDAWGEDIDFRNWPGLQEEEVEYTN